MPNAKLHLLCGKIASGKSTLAQTLSNTPGTLLIAEDAWLKTLFGDQMKTRADFLRCSDRLRAALSPHVRELLRNDLSVVLDFAANTVEQRAWMRAMIDEAGADHRLHLLDVPDEICLERLRARNETGDHPFAATEEQFYRFAKHFTEPSSEEGFNVIRH